MFLEEFRRADFGLLINDESGLEACFVAPAEKVTKEVVNKITKLTGGIFRVVVSKARADEFFLEPMFENSNELISVEAREGVSTGISAFDRARTISIFGETKPNPRALVKPGHIFPTAARPGGTLVKASLVEGALDLVVSAGFNEASLYVQFLENGNHPSQAAIDKLDCPKINLSELIAHRLNSEALVQLIAESKVPLREFGLAQAKVFYVPLHGVEHVAFVKGEISPDKAVMTRVQRESTIEDIFSNSSALTKSLAKLGEQDSGIFLYLRNPDKEPLYDAPRMREYGIGAQILKMLGARKLNLISSTSAPYLGLDVFDLEVSEITPL